MVVANLVTGALTAEAGKASAAQLHQHGAVFEVWLADGLTDSKQFPT